MKMAAKAILSPKHSSLNFEDRMILLEEPVKVGRSHKDDRPMSENAFFDCKVLSRSHALLSYNNGKFTLQDTGSSNGSFINNIRLSKSGEESKPTDIFTGDVIRFGSDVVDKAKNVTQKAVVAKLKLFYPDGTECVLRPPESRLFRPMDSFDEVEALNQTLQDTMGREKILEDKLHKIKVMISKPIGNQSQDVTRLIEGIHAEVSQITSSSDPNSQSGEGGDQEEKRKLERMLRDIELRLEEREIFCATVQRQQEADATEIIKLRQLVDKQNEDIADLEAALEQAQDSGMEGEEIRLKYEEKLSQTQYAHEDQLRKMKEHYETKLKETEDDSADEKHQLRQQLQDISANEIGLLNQIKALELEKDYARAELEKVLVRDTNSFSYKQELEYKIECLTTELASARQEIRDLEGKTTVERDPEDIAMIEEQKNNLVALREELAYVKKELIEARSRKAAAEDDLNTVKGTVETLTNSVNSLSSEGESLKKTILKLEESLSEKTREASHLTELLTAIESEPGKDEQMRIQIADLKQELSVSQAEVKHKLEDIQKLRTDLRVEREAVQQNHIEISRLNGVVEEKEEEKEALRMSAGNVDTLQAELNQIRTRFNLVVDELDVTRLDNQTLSRELEQLQVLYSELKKMRGMGEELELLQQTQRDVVIARDRAETALANLGEARGEISRLEGERMRLLREIAQLKSGKQAVMDQQPQQEAVNGTAEPVAQPPSSPTAPVVSKMMASEAMFSQMGSLKLYEIIVGLLFISVIISWNPYTLPL